MKLWALILPLCLSFSLTSVESSHEHMLEDQKAHAPKSLTADDADYVEPYTVSNSYLAVQGMKIKGFDSASLVKLEKAFEVAEKVVNSAEFKDRIINFKNSKGERAFASNNKLSNEQIFTQFMDGREMLQLDTPGVMNLYLSLYHKRSSNVVGWTNPKIKTININWKYFKKYKANEVAGNLVHEWTHKLGFGHKSAAEHDSAPYAIGYIVREMGERYLKGEELY